MIFFLFLFDFLCFHFFVVIFCYVYFNFLLFICTLAFFLFLSFFTVNFLSSAGKSLIRVVFFSRFPLEGEELSFLCCYLLILVINFSFFHFHCPSPLPFAFFFSGPFPTPLLYVRWRQFNSIQFEMRRSETNWRQRRYNGDADNEEIIMDVEEEKKNDNEDDDDSHLTIINWTQKSTLERGRTPTPTTTATATATATPTAGERLLLRTTAAERLSFGCTRAVGKCRAPSADRRCRRFLLLLLFFILSFATNLTNQMLARTTMPRDVKRRDHHIHALALNYL